MHLNMRWPNLSHSCEDSKFISTWDDQTHLMPARTIMHLIIVEQSPLIPERTQNPSPLVLTNSVTSQEGHKIHLSFVDQNQSMPARTFFLLKNPDPWVTSGIVPISPGPLQSALYIICTHTAYVYRMVQFCLAWIINIIYNTITYSNS